VPTTKLTGLALALAMLGPDFDPKPHDYPDFEKVFRSCLANRMPDKRTIETYIECSSFAVENTPEALYRILYLVGPKRVDFSDMRKTRLLAFRSKDRRFVVSVELYNYALGFYCYALKHLLDTSHAHNILVGQPGADNGIRLKDERDGAFFRMVQTAVTTTEPLLTNNLILGTY
jgi:hypothetical protein